MRPDSVSMLFSSTWKRSMNAGYAARAAARRASCAWSACIWWRMALPLPVMASMAPSSCPTASSPMPPTITTKAMAVTFQASM
jgi:hypothetical protein